MGCSGCASLATNKLPDPVSALPCAVVDTNFAWFKDRSPESIAEEIQAKRYASVRYIVTSSRNYSAAQVKALRDAGLPVILEVFGNGMYGDGGTPEGWQKWKMRLRKGESPADGYTYFCLNNPDYRKWRKADTVSMVKAAGFDAVEVAEAFWPAHGGPDSDSYGCLCEVCSARFKKETGSAPPDFQDANSPRYWKNDPKLYATWVNARSRWATEFIDDLFNSADGLRKQCPGVQVIAWGIASTSTSPETMREWEGVDGEAVARTARPDGYVVQTDWPDWIRADLKPDYVVSYKPFINAAHRGSSQMPVLVQTDSGSQKQMRRSTKWLAECDLHSREAGAVGSFAYMFSFEKDVYDAPIRLLRVKDLGGNIRMVLNKWPSKGIEEAGEWKCAGGKVISVRRDGCTLAVAISERRSREVTLGWKPVPEDSSVRLFKEPARSDWEQTSIKVRID